MNRETVLVVLLLTACDGTTPVADGGRLDARADGSPTTRCERESDCDDGLYCTAHLCRPGEPGADARGCIVDPNPVCADGQVCDETVRRCTGIDCSVPDADEDGHERMECGGDDCDDADANRHPGNAEVCDSGGHDEDCVPATLAGPTDGDRDGDGEVSSSCCFGEVCGGDCDDDDPNVNTSAREVCNGIDDDCSGTIDDAPPSSSLCPGGVCTGGRCSFTAWDRIFGGAGNDSARAIAVDDLGNVYLGGLLAPGVDFGSGPTNNAVVASYTASGVLRWVLVNEIDAVATANVLDMAFDSTAGLLYVLTTGAAEYGSIAISGGPYILAVRSDGSVVRHIPVPSLAAGASRSAGLHARDNAVVVASGFTSGVDPGDGTVRTPAGTMDGYVASYDVSGELRWFAPFGASGAQVHFGAVSIDSAGNVYASGQVSGSVDFGAGSVAAPGGAAIPVVSLDRSGAFRWAGVFGSPGSDRADAVESGADGVFVAGVLGGAIDFGGGSVGGDSQGYLLALTADGAYRWERIFRPTGSSGAVPTDLGVTPDGSIWVVGEFSGTVDFGGGGLSSFVDGGTPTSDVFMVLYGADRTHVRDRALGEADRQTAYGIAIGPGGSTTIAGQFYGSIDFGSGRRTAPSGAWGFVARTAD